MACLNVNRGVCDSFYRYKMPRIAAKVEGKGNGVKTLVTNMVEVAKALGRPPAYPTKYFGCELGAQVMCDVKKERFIINGSHDVAKLQDLLDGFIRRFVLCPECENPETDLLVNQKRGTIGQLCKACGHQNVIDMRHRLTAFILKNPPVVNSAYLTKAGKYSRDTADSGLSKCSSSRDDDSKCDPEESDDDWAMDVSQDAVKARLEDLAAGARTITLSATEPMSERDRIDEFYELVKAKKNEIMTRGSNVDKFLVLESERLDIRDKATLVLVEVLLSDAVLKELKIYRRILLRFCVGCPKAQKYLLSGIEQLVELHSEVLLPRVTAIMKTLYDLDIVDDEVFLEWEKRPSKKKLGVEIRARASPFLKWLREAEEDSSSESDECVDGVLFSNMDLKPKEIVTEDEIDIDAI